MLESGEAVLGCDISDDSQIASRDSKGEIASTSIICAPVRYDKQIVGLLHAYSTTGESSLTPDDLEFLMRLNFEGPFLGMKEAIPCMKEGGAIINITVLTAMVGNANSTAYSIAKGSLAHLTRAVARDCVHKKNGVRVNAIVPGVLFEGGVVSPGATRVHGGPDGARRFQEMIIAKTPLGRIGEPSDAAAAAVFLASDDARHVTAMEYVVDGGRMAGGN